MLDPTSVQQLERQRDLPLPVALLVGDAAERGIRRCHVGRAELDMVQRVESLHLELRPRLLPDPEVLV